MKTFRQFNEARHKQSKEEVNFRDGNKREHCGLCTMYRQPGHCTEVEGYIKPKDLCDLFERKAD